MTSTASIHLQKTQDFDKLCDTYNIPKLNKVIPVNLFTTSKYTNLPDGLYGNPFELTGTKLFLIRYWHGQLVLEFTNYQLYQFRKNLINFLNIPLTSIPLMSNKFHIILCNHIDKRYKDTIPGFDLYVNNFSIRSN